VSNIDFVANFHLAAITMSRCSVERGSGRPDGSVELKTEASMRADRDGSALAYTVRLQYSAVDPDDQPLITGMVEFVLGYQLDEGFEPSEEQLEHYAFGGVAFQVHPYLREHVMSMCTRAGLPPYALPILGRDESTPVMEHPEKK
jgi:hypothetical protein